MLTLGSVVQVLVRRLWDIKLKQLGPTCRLTEVWGVFKGVSEREYYRTQMGPAVTYRMDQRNDREMTGNQSIKGLIKGG